GRLAVLDGSHRLARALAEGVAALPAKTLFAAELAACRADAAPAVPEFVQAARFTLEHARALTEGRLTLADLIRDGIAEYITPEEHENCLIAESIDVLAAHRHDVTMQFSHVDVEQAILGLAAHVSPYGDHTQPARV